MYRKSLLSTYRRSITTAYRQSSVKQYPLVIHLDNNVLFKKYVQNERYVAASQSLLIDIKYFHTNNGPVRKDPESKAEQTVNMLKENKILPDVAKPVTEVHKTQEELRLSLWGRIVKELKHYYNGFKLLYLETKIATRLLLHVLNGNTLTRRERKQFTRTVADLFRLVPFSIFIIVPFMEFTLPIFLKLFPNMLPSTFKEESKEQDKLKVRLKAKLEMAKFLQDTLEETALKSDKGTVDPLNQKFSEFMKKVRSKGEQPTNEEIIKFGSLFENELTLDNLSRQQLIALCKILDVSTLGGIPPNHMLRFQLRMKIRTLEADDHEIINEGIDNLDIKELQQACRDRGMRALGLSPERLKSQLEQWLDLHINRKIPLSLLILSRALYLPENLPAEDIIKNTISQLPLSIENATIAKLAEMSGSKIDNAVKLQLLKAEDAEIKQEEKEAETEKIMEPVVLEKDFAQEQLSKEILVDKASTMIISPEEIKEITQIIENIPSNEKSQVRAEIAELKKDVDEYKEDVMEVEQLASATKLTETKSAKLLGKRVQKLIADMDKLMHKMESENGNAAVVEKVPTNKNTVSIDELMSTIKKIRGVTSDIKDKRLILVLESLDKDHDGKIDDLNDVLKVFDLIEQENVNVTKDQLTKILTLLEKEKILEIQEDEQKAQQQQQANK